jgi:hypothetical protein
VVAQAQLHAGTAQIERTRAPEASAAARDERHASRETRSLLQMAHRNLLPGAHGVR